MIKNQSYKVEEPFIVRLKKDLKVNTSLYFIVLPVLLFYLVFRYFPMYGTLIAFKNYSPGLGIFGSPWVGFSHFIRFFTGNFFVRVVSNTFILSFYELLFGFPMPIILAILINEVRSRRYRKLVQTVTYMPFFISLVVVCGMIVQFSATDGIINDIIYLFGGRRVPLMQRASYFRPMFIISGIWQHSGWGSIIYLAALMAIDPSLYESAEIDGANRFQKIRYITIPSIVPTIVIMFILRMGRILDIGFEKIILLYNPSTYQVADVISSYVYRVGLTNFSWSYSTAVGLVNSVVNLMFLVAANKLSKKATDSSLW